MFSSDSDYGQTKNKWTHQTPLNFQACLNSEFFTNFTCELDFVSQYSPLHWNFTSCIFFLWITICFADPKKKKNYLLFFSFLPLPFPSNFPNMVRYIWTLYFPFMYFFMESVHVPYQFSFSLAILFLSIWPKFCRNLPYLLTTTIIIVFYFHPCHTSRDLTSNNLKVSSMA